MVLRVFSADVDHLGAGIGLLPAVHHRHRVELADRVVALEDDARVLPGDGRSGLDLGPGDLGTGAGALAPLGDEVVDPALPLRVAGVPVLDRRVLDGGALERHQLDHRGVQLVLVPLRRGAALEVADVGALVGHDQRALELAGGRGVDPEVGGELQRAADAFRDVHEGPVAEHRGVERREEVVARGHHRAEVLPHQLGMLAHGLAEGAEDDPLLRELGLVGGADRNRVEDGVHRDPGQDLLLRQRDAELLVGLEQLGIHLVEAAQRLGGPRCRVVADGLVVHRRVADVGPGVGLAHLEPATVGLEPPLQQPLRLALFRGDQADDVLAQARRRDIGLDVGDPAVLVLLVDQRLDLRAHDISSAAPGNRT